LLYILYVLWKNSIVLIFHLTTLTYQRIKQASLYLSYYSFHLFISIGWRFNFYILDVSVQVIMVSISITSFHLIHFVNSKQSLYLCWLINHTYSFYQALGQFWLTKNPYSIQTLLLSFNFTNVSHSFWEDWEYRILAQIQNQSLRLSNKTCCFREFIVQPILFHFSNKQKYNLS
jgi:hypothetical protein